MESAAEGTLHTLLTRYRVRLASWPTPVERLHRIEKELGYTGELYIKRDDVACFAFGGSKIRKFEILIGEAMAENADTLVTIGTTHSNCARLTAAVAAKRGMRCSLVLSGVRPSHPTGNLLLCELLGADIAYVSTNDARPAAKTRVLERLREEGRRPFEVPLSAATALSALTMVEAAIEVVAEAVRPDVIVVCSSSGATQAGLLIGCALRKLPVRVIGVSPDDPADDVHRRVQEWIDVMLPMLGIDRTDLPPIDVVVEGDFAIGPPHAGVVKLFAAKEGILLDPMYTGKAAAAMVRAVERRDIQSETLLFWHTGGQVGLFSEADCR